jgi:hypothetical protein
MRTAEHLDDAGDRPFEHSRLQDVPLNRRQQRVDAELLPDGKHLLHALDFLPHSSEVARRAGDGSQVDRPHLAKSQLIGHEESEWHP